MVLEKILSEIFPSKEKQEKNMDYALLSSINVLHQSKPECHFMMIDQFCYKGKHPDQENMIIQKEVF